MSAGSRAAANSDRVDLPDKDSTLSIRLPMRSRPEAIESNAPGILDLPDAERPPMSIDDIHAKPGHLIRRAQQIAVAIFMEECAPFEITPVQYAALVAIRDNPDIDATRLSALVALDRSTLGIVLERLEAKGQIERAACPQDRRLKTLRLSREGARTVRQAESAVEKAQERILAPLKPEDRRRFMALLTQLVELNNEASRAPLRLARER